MPEEAPPEPRRFDPLLAPLLLAFAALHLAYVDYSPIFDTTAYAECLHDAVQHHAFAELNCARHPSLAYLGVLALPQLVFFTSAAATHVTNVLLGLVALVAFHGLLGALFPDPSQRALRLGGTGLLAFLPVVNGNLLNWTPDFGAYVFFTGLVSALARAKWKQVVLWGLLVTFSKESGALAYLLAIVAFLVSAVPGRVPARERGRWLLRHAVWLVPSLLYAAFLKSRGSSGDSGLWRHQSPADLVAMFGRLDFDRHLAACALGLFVLGFLWLFLPFLVAALGPAFRALRTAFRDRALPDAVRLRLFLVVLLAAGFWALTRFKTFTHPRYLLLLYPLLLALFLAAVASVLPRPRAQTAVLAVLGVLFLVSNFRTVDPLSRRVWGTFPFGDHELLKITSITGECCGYGQDGLTYDFEFAELHYLADAAYRDLRPTNADLLAIPAAARAWVAWRLENGTFARTLQRTGSFNPHHIGVEDERVLPYVSGRVILLEFPTTDPTPARMKLRARYPSLGRRTYERDGYRLEVEIFDGRGVLTSR